MTVRLGLALALAAASAGVGARAEAPLRSPASLSVTPAHVHLAGAASGTIRVTNAGADAVVVDAGFAGYALDTRGRPLIARRATTRFLVRPRRFSLRPGGVEQLSVRAVLPRTAAPGEHDGLVLLDTRSTGPGHLSVSLQVGIVVDVRVPGKVVRRLVVRSLQVRRTATGRALHLVVANRGNISESLVARVSLLRRGRLVARLLPRPTGHGPQRILPRAAGVVDLPYRGSLRGRMVAVVALVQPAGRTIVRRFAVVL